MTNPFYDAHPTSLGRLSAHDWAVMSSRWHRGIDWNIHRVGRRWELFRDFGNGVPLFNTKKAAYEYGSNLIRAEARHRAMLAWEAEQVAA